MTRVPFHTALPYPSSPQQGILGAGWASVTCFIALLLCLNRLWLFFTDLQIPCMVVMVQWLSHIWLFAAPWTAAWQASLSFTISQSLLKLMSIGLVMPSNHLIPCHPLLLLSSIFPIIRVLSKHSALLIRWPKYWSFSFSISSSNEYSGLISFRNDWFDLLVVQVTLKSFLQHHSLKASMLWQSAFFMVTSVHDYWKKS